MQELNRPTTWQVVLLLNDQRQLSARLRMHKEDFQQDGKDVRTILAVHTTSITTHGRRAGLDLKQAEREQRRRGRPSAITRPLWRDRDIKTVPCQKTAQVPAPQVCHNLPLHQQLPARHNLHKCLPPAQPLPEQESFHRSGSRDTPQKDAPTSSTITQEPRHGSILAASSTSACTADKTRPTLSSSSQYHSLDHCHPDGKCGLPTLLECTLSTTTRRLRLGMIHVFHLLSIRTCHSTREISDAS